VRTEKVVPVGNGVQGSVGIFDNTYMYNIDGRCDSSSTEKDIHWSSDVPLQLPCPVIWHCISSCPSSGSKDVSIGNEFFFNSSEEYVESVQHRGGGGFNAFWLSSLAKSVENVFIVGKAVLALRAALCALVNAFQPLFCNL
jgi:hypothetical protein